MNEFMNEIELNQNGAHFSLSIFYTFLHYSANSLRCKSVKIIYTRQFVAFSRAFSFQTLSSVRTNSRRSVRSILMTPCDVSSLFDPIR